MPEMPEKFDDQRYDKILTNALLIANLWLAVALAAKRKDKTSAYSACENIRQLNLQTFPLVKELGSEKAKPEVDGSLVP